MTTNSLIGRALRACATLGFLLSPLLLVGPGTAYAADPTKPGKEFHDCADCPQMVVVPAGSFKMGSVATNEMKGGEARGEGPLRDITIAKPFAMGKFEVTNSQYGAFVDATGYHTSTSCSVNQTDTAKITFRGPLFGKTPNPKAPVVCVSWNDAVAYVSWLSGKTGKPYRLVSEAEWEYAARANTKTKWPWGDDDMQSCKYENVFDLDGEVAPPTGKLPWPAVACHDGQATLAPVGSYPPNPFGLHDMLGNAWEWVEDCAVNPYPATPVDGSAVEVNGDCAKRSVRGASWYTRLDRHRPSFRGADGQTTATHQFGFRIARDLK